MMKFALLLITTSFLLLPTALFGATQTPDALRQKFHNAKLSGGKIRILVVPGHEPDFGGTEYRALKERELVLDIADYFISYLEQNPHYEVFTTRTKAGWNPEFEAYFKDHWGGINSFVTNKKQELFGHIATGTFTEVGDGMPHNDAPTDVATRLFGINMWANENKVDITLHLHINDSHPRRFNQPGEYSGLAIYMPERQFSNASISQPLALKIYQRLSNFFATSNLEQESNGLIQNQDLIAIGSWNTAKSASLLIEYGYIYEPQFQYSSIRNILFREFALQTYLGLSDFFGEKIEVGNSQDTNLFPYTWRKNLTISRNPNPDVLALQALLTDKGFYPPRGSTKNECPISGIFGGCTKRAVAQFQKHHKIVGDGSIVGVKTRAKLNSLHIN